MARYIDADAFEVFKYELVGGSSEYRDGFDDGVEYVLRRIDDIPTADVQPVVRGEWIDKGDRYYYCSVCGSHYTDNHIYCPCCGARMVEE